MAEVKLEVVAEDKTQSAFDSVKQKLEGLLNLDKKIVGMFNPSFLQTIGTKIAALTVPVIAEIITAIALLVNLITGKYLKAIASGIEAIKVEVEAIGDILRSLDSSFAELSEKELSLNTTNAVAAVHILSTALEALPLRKVLWVGTLKALQSIDEVKARLASIPNTTTKTVIIKYMTESSPVRPFSEGIKYIREKMEALPRGGNYTLRLGSETGLARPGTGQAGPSIATAPGINFSPTINIHSTGSHPGEALAAEIDSALAELWRGNRSELRRALQS